MHKFANIVDRFMAKVIKLDNGCWKWNGKKSERYGRFYKDGKFRAAHRISYELFINPIPKYLCVLHKCDNGFCVNPEHLIIGTQKDNVKDMFNKNRDNHARGDRVNTAKLSWKQVREIRKKYIPRKVSTVFLGKEYGVSDVAIGCIVRGLTWKE